MISLKIQLLIKPGPLEAELAGRIKGSRAKFQTSLCLVTAIIMSHGFLICLIQLNKRSCHGTN